MSDVVSQRVGPVIGARGSTPPQTADITGATRASDAHGKYFDPVYNRSVYSLHLGGATVAAANGNAGALGTIAYIPGFYNPMGSGKIAVILRAAVGTISGTPAGPFFFGFFAGINAVNFTPTGTIFNNYLGSSRAGASAMVPASNVAIVTAPASTQATLNLSLLGGPAAIASGAGLYTIVDDVAGRYIVPPGTVFGITASGAGTSHIIHSSLEWEELDLP